MVSVARDYTRHPGPRYIRQGPGSGEGFRSHLVKALRNHERVLVDLDGTMGYGSSFLDEAFGGLVRSEGFSREELLVRLEIKSEVDTSYRDEAIQAIKEAALPSHQGLAAK